MATGGAIRVLELRSVAGTGGGPDKTLLQSALISDPEVELTLCYLCNEGDRDFQIGARAKEAGFEYVEIRERSSFDLRTWKAVRALVRDRHFDIVHGHEYKTDLLAFLLGKAERVIPFATAHGWTGQSWRERRLYYPADKRLLARFPRVAAVSGEIKRALIDAGGDPDRIDVVLNGIDAETFRRDPSRRADARAYYGLEDDAIVIGAVGRLEPQKRFDLLISAFPLLSRGSERTRLLIAGDGSLKAALEDQIARLGLTNRVRLVGHADVTAFHHALDVFVQSSDYEGTPNVVLEAMALETPLVATDVGGTAELVTDDVHGLIVDAGDAHALARAIDRIVTDPIAAAARVRAARMRVESELSFRHRMRRINSLYRRLITERRGN